MTLSKQSNLELCANNIDLWFTFYDQIQDRSLLRRYRLWLAEEELDQEAEFYFAEDRIRYLVTRALVRAVLSRYIPIPPEQWRFKRNAYGRPEIGNNDFRARRLSFNISHTRSLIMLGVTRDGAIGVDIENIRAREAPLEVASSFFAPDENTAIEAMPAGMRSLRFWEYWTLKESYIKAKGKGLSIPLKDVRFDLSRSPDIEAHFCPALDDNPSRWKIWQLRPTEDYLAAVCVQRLERVRRELVMRRIVPLLSEERVEYIISRQSCA